MFSKAARSGSALSLCIRKVSPSTPSDKCSDLSVWDLG